MRRAPEISELAEGQHAVVPERSGMYPGPCLVQRGMKSRRSAAPRVSRCSMEPVTLSFATCVISATHVWPS